MRNRSTQHTRKPGMEQCQFRRVYYTSNTLSLQGVNDPSRVERNHRMRVLRESSSALRIGRYVAALFKVVAVSRFTLAKSSFVNGARCVAVLEGFAWRSGLDVVCLYGKRPATMLVYCNQSQYMKLTR